MRAATSTSVGWLRSCSTGSGLYILYIRHIRNRDPTNQTHFSYENLPNFSYSVRTAEANCRMLIRVSALCRRICPKLFTPRVDEIFVCCADLVRRFTFANSFPLNNKQARKIKIDTKRDRPLFARDIEASEIVHLCILLMMTRSSALKNHARLQRMSIISFKAMIRTHGFSCSHLVKPSSERNDRFSDAVVVTIHLLRVLNVDQEKSRRLAFTSIGVSSCPQGSLWSQL